MLTKGHIPSMSLKLSDSIKRPVILRVANFLNITAYQTMTLTIVYISAILFRKL